MNKMNQCKFIHICYVIFILFIPLCDGRRYRNFTLYRAIPIVETHLNFFRELNKFYEVVFWRGPGNLYSPIDFIISPNDKMMFLMEVDKQKIFLATIMPDVQKDFDEQIQPYAPYIPKDLKTFNWKSYARLDDIYAWMDDLTQEFPREVTVFNIGTTYEGRQIKAARVVLEGARRGSKIVIEGGIHGREWISPAFVTYLLNEVLNSTNSKDEVFKEIATNYEWYFIPVLNPDGYEFSHVKDRLWRKNRRPFGTTVVQYGVDLNRNFGIAFGTGFGNHTTDEFYPGPEEFSEAESSSIRKLVGSLTNIAYYIAIHSYGNFIIIPYSHVKEHLDNYDDVALYCDIMVNSIANKYNSHYLYGNSFETLGSLNGGTSTSYFKKKRKIPFTLSLHLGELDYGFALPANSIIRTMQEGFTGVVSLMSASAKSVNRRVIDNDDDDDDEDTSRNSTDIPDSAAKSLKSDDDNDYDNDEERTNKNPNLYEMNNKDDSEILSSSTIETVSSNAINLTKHNTLPKHGGGDSKFDEISNNEEPMADVPSKEVYELKNTKLHEDLPFERPSLAADRPAFKNLAYDTKFSQPRMITHVARRTTTHDYDDNAAGNISAIHIAMLTIIFMIVTTL
ncbi:zinc carboxypeptidase A 1 isoform X1 [Plutella xylostella]|uniref:zinc carboxypeptidase A 1 isoform X1 n=2 Tax=Plutella xylostella TaxID=51655 RepID=UPI0020322F8D|nr:zinc carboxypeptidase A 1 isoform X1 [Plutella xylostella]